MPRYMLLLHADEHTEAGEMPSAKVIEEMGQLMEDMAAAGVILGGEGLKPSSAGRRVRFADGKITSVTDGPFAETKELIAGYALVQVDSMDEVMKWSERFAAVSGTGLSEIRPLYEASDFPTDIMPLEAQAREEELRQELQRRQAQG